MEKLQSGISINGIEWLNELAGKMKSRVNENELYESSCSRRNPEFSIGKILWRKCVLMNLILLCINLTWKYFQKQRFEVKELVQKQMRIHTFNKYNFCPTGPMKQQPASGESWSPGRLIQEAVNMSAIGWETTLVYGHICTNLSLVRNNSMGTITVSFYEWLEVARATHNYKEHKINLICMIFPSTQQTPTKGYKLPQRDINSNSQSLSYKHWFKGSM